MNFPTDRIGSFAVRHLDRALPMVGSLVGALPNFLIIGGQRCGTTVLYRYLSQHPQIFPALTKEVHFFDLNHSRGEAWYRGHFPKRIWWPFKNPEQFVTGEATPYYLYHPSVPQRVHSLIPSVKLIVLLRNPIKRAWSHYQRECRMARESLPFAEALRLEADRIETDGPNPGEEHQRYSYRARGVYIEQLHRWCRFFDRAQLLVIRSESFFREPLESLARICRHIGIDEWTGWKPVPPNPSSYPSIDPSLMAQLAEYYHPYNRRLSDWLSVDQMWPDPRKN